MRNDYRKIQKVIEFVPESMPICVVNNWDVYDFVHRNYYYRDVRYYIEMPDELKCEGCVRGLYILSEYKFIIQY